MLRQLVGLDYRTGSNRNIVLHTLALSEANVLPNDAVVAPSG